MFILFNLVFYYVQYCLLFLIFLFMNLNMYKFNYFYVNIRKIEYCTKIFDIFENKFNKFF